MTFEMITENFIGDLSVVSLGNAACDQVSLSFSELEQFGTCPNKLVPASQAQEATSLESTLNIDLEVGGYWRINANL